MKSDLLRNFRSLFQEKKVRFNKRILIFFFFLLLSSFIWLLTILDKEYIADLNFPVRYFNFPEDKIETKDLPEFFTLRVEASGYLLLKHKIGKTLNPLQIDIEKYLPDVLLNDTVGFTIKSSNFREGIENQLSKQISVIDIKPERIDFLFSKKTSKSVKIIPIIEYKLEKQFVLKNTFTLLPEYVIVSGPVYVIDTLQSIPTIPINIGVIGENITENIKLQPIKNLSYSSSSVLLKIEVEKYTETSLQVPLTINNLPDSINIQIVPEKVKVNYCIGLSYFNNIKPSQFNLEVDYNEIKTNNASKLSVYIKNAPSKVFNINIHPKAVDFVIKK